MGFGVLRRRSLGGRAESKSDRPALSNEEADYGKGSSSRGDLSASMKVPFTKAHGARNDFLLTPRELVPEGADLPVLARAICDRHTGAGADGWIVISPSSDADAAIELWNSDGSGSALSGNGTRCVALYLVQNGLS